MKIFLIFGILLSLTSFNLYAESLDERSYELNIQKSSHGRLWKPSYTEVLHEIFEDEEFEKLFNTDINEEDLKRLSCTNLNELTKTDKKYFYTIYLAAIAEAESDLRPEVVTKNKFKGNSNYGLFQIDSIVARENTKGILGKITNKELLDPLLNIKVSAYILKNQVRSKIARTRLLPPKSYYWKVLTRSRKFFKHFENNIHLLKFCKS